MRTVEVTLYKFDELSNTAKDKAREWLRRLEAEDFGSDSTSLYEPYETAAKLLGIEFSTRPVKLMGGGTRYDSDIRWSGFSSQGDGASFVGEYSYAKGSAKAIASEFPKDAELQRIAVALQELQRKHGYKLKASVSQSGRYYHSHTMSIGFTAPESLYSQPTVTAAVVPWLQVEDELLSLMRHFADWIYNGLREEYEYRLSDESIDETIMANEYDFRVDGTRSDG